MAKVKMFLTEQEMWRTWNGSDNKPYQIRVLAELNVCRKVDIEDWLREHGITDAEMKSKKGCAK